MNPHVRALALTSVLVLAGGLASTPLGSAAASGAAAGTCLGAPVTITGSDGGTVIGTEGPDVIVTGGADLVRSLGGDDLVCVTSAEVDVVTGPGSDQVEVNDPAGVTFAGTIDTQGGADHVEIGYESSAAGAVVAGGTGVDYLGVVGNGAGGALAHDLVEIDLGRQRLVVRSGVDMPPSIVTGFEQAGASALVVRLVGDDGDNQLVGGGCDTQVSGLAGDDRIFGASVGLSQCGSSTDSRLRGGPGRDYLNGSGRLDDLLVGGSGQDVADGHGGDDTCRAETRRHCELD